MLLRFYSAEVISLEAVVWFRSCVLLKLYTAEVL